MTPSTIKEKIVAIAQKKSVLVQLSAQDNLGNLTIDIMQALEEIDELIGDFQKTFPDCSII